ncbi:MAG: TIGR03545 family protein [Bacteriovoracaceae bacterium]|nr:TIGR03545 family protein [Bacteriovoracaceae bacterium]
MTVSTVKKTKAKGPIRWGAVVPIILISGSLFLYGKYALDNHLRKAVIWSIERTHGAEVNLKSLKLSFLKGSLALNGLEITDKESPSLNLLAIKNIFFNLNTYELLKAKFIVETSEITGIEWGTPRKKPGVIFPIPKKSKNESLAKLEASTIKAAQENFQGNALENVANVLGGNDAKSELKDIKAELTTEKKIKELEAELKGKEEFYKKKISDLKSQEEFNKVKSSVKQYKWNKNDPIASLKSLNDLVKQTKSVAKKYEDDIKAIKEDVKKIEDVSKNIDQWIEEDMNSLQSKAGLPNLDAEKLAFSLFGTYFGTNVAKYRKYSEIAKEYMPPPKTQRKKSDLLPTKRGQGKNYLFPKVGENPKVWIKKVKISSQAGKSAHGGNLEGQITDITTAPQIINKPVVIKINGEFPQQKLFGLALNGTIDHREEVPNQKINLSISQFPFKEQKLSSSSDLSLKLLTSPGSLNFNALKVGEEVDVGLSAKIIKPNFDVSAKKKLVEEIVTSSLQNMQALTLEGNAKGKWESLKWKFNSNIGKELALGFKKELGQRVAKAKQELKEKLMAKIGPQKQKYENEVKKIKGQLNQTLDKQKDKLKGDLDNLLSDLKGEQKNSLKKNTEKLKGEAKKLFKKLF